MYIGDVKNAKKTFPLAMASTVGLMTVSTELSGCTGQMHTPLTKGIKELI
jgi:hypothetical protein